MMIKYEGKKSYLALQEKKRMVQIYNCVSKLDLTSSLVVGSVCLKIILTISFHQGPLKDAVEHRQACPP